MAKVLLQQSSFLREKIKTQNTKLVWLTNLKTDRGLNKFCEIAGINKDEIFSINYGGEKDGFLSSNETWDTNTNLIIEYIFKQLRGLEGYSEDSEIEIWQFGSIITEGGRAVDKFLAYGERKDGHKFKITERNLQKILLAHHLLHCRGLKTNHLILDPDEIVLKSHENYKKYHGYKDEEKGFLRLDSLQYYLKNFVNETQPNTNRPIDFTFGATVYAKNRLWLHDYIVELKSTLNLNQKIYYTNKFLDIEGFIDRDEYLQQLAISKYTLIIRSYEESSFSAYRVIESVYKGCLPLFHTNSNWHHLLNSFEIDESWLTNNLLVTSAQDIKAKIKSISEKDRVEFCNHLYKALF